MTTLDIIVKQLDEQNIQYEILQSTYISQSENVLTNKVKDWSEKFIADKSAPYLDHYLWHIFSYGATRCLDGADAEKELAKQFEADTLIFNESQQFLIKCIKRIPKIEMLDFSDDIYLCHHNMKWTFVIPHEVNSGMGPYFSYGV